MMAEILFADDDAAMREMVADMLRTASHKVRLASNGREALDELRRSAPDLVLLDYRMGIPDGLEVCRTIKADPRFGHLPVLIITGEGRLESRLMGFDAGADDYLPKPFDTRELLARIAALLRLARRGLDRNPTSQLPGGEAILTEYERRQWLGRAFAVCYLDLDDFKAFNDRFGFHVADAVIRETGDVLRHVSEGTEAFVGHVGGDDFIMLCEPESARRLAEEARSTLRQRLERHLPVEIVRTGHYSSLDRNNLAREYPVTRLAAAIMYIPAEAGVSLATIGEAVAGVKQHAKRPGGSGVAEAEFRP
jgi:PleD family two-component response regulator